MTATLISVRVHPNSSEMGSTNTPNEYEIVPMVKPVEQKASTITARPRPARPRGMAAVVVCTASPSHPLTAYCSSPTAAAAERSIKVACAAIR